MKELLRVGVVGLGCRGMELLRACILPQKDVQVVAVCEQYADRLEKGVQMVLDAGQPAPRGVADYRELLGMENLDAVVITASWDSHIDLACDFMQHMQKELEKYRTEVEETIPALYGDFEKYKKDAERRILVAQQEKETYEYLYKKEVLKNSADAEMEKNYRLLQEHAYRLQCMLDFERQRLDCILNSNSWKITKGLRTARHMFGE